jgi:hypothetical protein
MKVKYDTSISRTEFFFSKINCIKLQTIQEKHKKRKRTSYRSSIMEELKEGELSYGKDNLNLKKNKKGL